MTGIQCAAKMPTTPKKKKRGLMHALYAAFFGSGHAHAAAKKPESPETTAGTISMIVSSIRPLHMADGGVQSPPPPPSPPTFTPASPAAASSVAGTNTSYASADFGDKVFELDEDLKTGEIKENEAENDVVQEEEEEEVIGGASAMMIGMFYQKIRTQALNSIGVVRG